MNALFDLLETECAKSFSGEKVLSLPVAMEDPFSKENKGCRQVVRKEELYVGGNKVIVHRVYCRLPEYMEYRYVGWAVYDDVDACMICSSSFWPIIDTKYHCKICGNIVCEKCLSGLVQIKELSDLGYVDACACCFWGQV
jgi:hypothetical protein